MVLNFFLMFFARTAICPMSSELAMWIHSHLRLSAFLPLGYFGSQLVVLVQDLVVSRFVRFGLDIQMDFTSFFPASEKPNSLTAGHVLKAIVRTETRQDCAFFLLILPE